MIIITLEDVTKQGFCKILLRKLRLRGSLFEVGRLLELYGTLIIVHRQPRLQVKPLGTNLNHNTTENLYSPTILIISRQRRENA